MVSSVTVRVLHVSQARFVLIFMYENSGKNTAQHE